MITNQDYLNQFRKNILRASLVFNYAPLSNDGYQIYHSFLFQEQITIGHTSPLRAPEHQSALRRDVLKFAVTARRIPNLGVEVSGQIYPREIDPVHIG
jgi:hypothetical protein